MQELRQNSTLQGGKYKIVRVLGQGGFGITYEGIQTGLNRRVAIKEFFMKDYCERDGQTSHVTVGSTSIHELVEKYREKFIREAQMIASFDGAPHIVQIYDIFEENETAYYVMRYVEGGSLSLLVKEQGPLPAARAISLIIQTGQALSYLHAHQTMHRDIKPANILLDRDADGKDSVILIDFGISKHYTYQGHATTTSPIAYSKGFAPLEQYNEGGVLEFSPTSDVYSLGATLYFLLTGQTPPEATLLIEDPLEQPANISNEIWQIITHAMEPSRKRRFQTVDEMMQTLKNPNISDTSFLSDRATVVGKEFISTQNEETKASIIEDNFSHTIKNVDLINGQNEETIIFNRHPVAWDGVFPPKTLIVGGQNDYVILQCLCKGTCVKYIATTAIEGKKVWLFQSPKTKEENEKEYSSLIRSMQLACLLKHPGLSKCIEAFEWNGYAYGAIEYIEGKKLSKIVEGKVMTEKEARRIMKPIEDVFGYLEKRKIDFSYCKGFDDIISTDSKNTLVLFDFLGLRHSPNLPDKLQNNASALADMYTLLLTGKDRWRVTNEDIIKQKELSRGMQQALILMNKKEKKFSELQSVDGLMKLINTPAPSLFKRIWN